MTVKSKGKQLLHSNHSLILLANYIHKSECEEGKWL